MKRVYIDQCNAVIGIILRAAESLWSLRVSEAVQKSQVVGKSDTFRLDAIPEIHMRSLYEEYDPYVVFVTEETGAHSRQPYYPLDNRNKFPITDVSDPFDRSVPTQKFFERQERQDQTIWELFSNPETKARWESEMGAPAEITGSCSAITRLIRGVPVFTVIVNFVTRQLVVACSAGVYCLTLPGKREKLSHVNLAYVKQHGTRVYFPDINHHDNAARFVTFLKKAGYPENLSSTKLVEPHELVANIHFDDPGGPLRPLYLSTMHPDENRPGFILSNGEKLGEWVHWLTFLRFARKPLDDSDAALKLHEVYGSSSNIRDGVMIAPTPPYSLFRTVNDREDVRDPDAFILDVGFFPRFPVPSRIRSTLVLAPNDNQWINNRLMYHGYRQIVFHPE